jgi:KTSC domain-containing protein
MVEDMAVDATWHILASTMLRAVAYDPDTRELRVRFTNGTNYRYFDVPADVVESLLDPPDASPGRFFNDHVRDAFEFQED